MTTTTHRSEAELLRALADEYRTGRHVHLSGALLVVMHGESHDRYVNLAAALATDLHQDEPINRFDVDELPVRPVRDGDPGVPDHPGAYAMRLDVWAARIADPALVAAALDDLADREARELAGEATRARVGGRSLLPASRDLVGGDL